MQDVTGRPKDSENHNVKTKGAPFALRQTCIRGAFVAAALLVPAMRLEGALEWSKLEERLKPPPGTRTVEADFPFTNTGAQTVTITDVQTSCGCLSTELEKRTIEPGESGSIHAVFRMPDHGGKHSKTIRVTTDDSPDSPVQLAVHAELTPAYTLSPRILRWKSGEGVEPRRVELKLTEGASLSAPRIAAVPRGFTASLDPVEGAAGTLALMVAPESTASKHRASLSVQFDSADGGAPVTARVQLIVE